jgi:uncharacterized protein (TIGR02246 family)
MNSDEQQIRELIATWMRASAAGDLDQVLKLMDDDVIFLIPGQSPMRKEGFVKGFEGLRNVLIEGKSNIQEIQVEGNFAYCWTQLSVTATPFRSGKPVHREGHTLSVFRKKPEGNWVLFRDANLLVTKP